MSAEARTLTIDLECTPNLGWSWGKYDQNILSFEQDWYVLSVAYKWLDEDEVHCIALRDFRKTYKADPTDDSAVIAKVHGLLSEAAIVCGHNSQAFDMKKLNARFLYWGLTPPAPYLQVDTYRVARKHFDFTSNKLGDLCTFLGIGSKVETGGFGLWLSVMNGEKAAWDRMIEYNKADVAITEALYLKMLPWIDGHPNVGYLNGKPDGCPKCGSTKLIKQGFKYAKTTTRQRWQCTSCWGWCSSRIAEKVGPPSFTN